MTKYLFILLWVSLLTPAIKAETSTNDFEAELRLLESRDLLQEEKAELLVEKMSTQNNSNRENDVIEDSVSTKKAATTTTTTPTGPDSEPGPLNPTTTKKTRRIPSR
ncbi:MAG: hypothetical protein PHY93_07570 [Bacteriovorax sp.]|nr:hypothetical protein [Bacteriovorax sp.]